MAAATGGRAPRILHPALFGVAPLLLLFSHNRDQVAPRDLLGPLVVALLVVALLWALARALLGRSRGALAASALALAFLGFGHFRQLGEQALGVRFRGLEDGLLAAALALAIALTGVRLARREIPESVHRLLDRAGLALVGSSALVILLSALRTPSVPPAEPERHAADRGGAGGPDVYYLILDGYGRRDVLREHYGFDAGPLVDALAAQGFFVADQAYANYGQTLFSIASALNLEYLDGLAAQVGADSQDRRPVVERVRDSFLVRFLRERGYRIYAFETGYDGTELRDADRYLVPAPGLSEFETTALEMTPLGALARRSRRLDAFGQHRRRILYTIDQLPALAREPGPKFVFAHVVAPHPPFVFLEDGSPAPNEGTFRMRDGSHFLATSTREAYVAGYRAQIAFLSRRVEASLRALLQASEGRAVIVVQGDHGPGSRLDHDSLEGTDLHERMAILNAYHLPGAAPPPLHPGISPVNSFRVVLNRYFGEDLPLLPDRSFFSIWERPYAFHDVTDARSAPSPRPDTLAQQRP